jgi:hypothetical protein
MVDPDVVANLAVNIAANDFSRPILGVPLTTIAGAVLGTYASIGYDEQVRPRGKLFARAIATTILAASAAGVLPHLIGWTWVQGGIEGAIAALTAAVIYYTMEPVTTRVRTLIRSFTLADLPFFNRNKTPPASPPPDKPRDAP